MIMESFYLHRVKCLICTTAGQFRSLIGFLPDKFEPENKKDSKYLKY